MKEAGSKFVGLNGYVCILLVRESGINLLGERGKRQSGQSASAQHLEMLELRTTY